MTVLFKEYFYVSSVIKSLSSHFQKYAEYLTEKYLTKKNSKIFWSLDDQFIGSTEGFHQLALSPVAGKHVITLTDQYGTAVSREFEIIVKK